jgi:hypothetical protein
MLKLAPPGNDETDFDYLRSDYLGEIEATRFYSLLIMMKKPRVKNPFKVEYFKKLQFKTYR